MASHHIRFLVKLGEKSKTPIHGICPLCRREGKLGDLCITCSEDEGMDVGTCSVCYTKGELGMPWSDCECGAKYEEEDHTIGECFRCNGTGT
jgi:hypothetical protein